MGQGPRGRLQQVAAGVPRQRGLQGELHRDDDRGHRRVPGQAAAAHRPGLRGRDGHDDGRQGGGQAGLRADGPGRREVRPEGLRPGGDRLLHDGGWSDALAPAQQLDAGALLQQGCLQEGGAGSEQAAQDLARDGRVREEDPGRRISLRLQQPVAAVDPPRELLRLAQRAHSPASRTGSAASTPNSCSTRPSTSACIEQLAQWQKTKTFDYGGRKGDSQSEVLGDGGVRHVPGLVGALRERREGGQGQVRVRNRHDAVLARRQGRAAELDHRRGHAVGARRPPAGAVQGRGEVLHVPLLTRGSGGLAPADRIPADHAGRLRADEEAGVLREEPGHGHLDPPDEQQASDRATRRDSDSATSSRSAT